MFLSTKHFGDLKVTSCCFGFHYTWGDKVSLSKVLHFCKLCHYIQVYLVPIRVTDPFDLVNSSIIFKREFTIFASDQHFSVILPMVNFIADCKCILSVLPTDKNNENNDKERSLCPDILKILNL